MPAQPPAQRPRPANTVTPVRKAAAPKPAAHKVAVRTVPAQPAQRQIAYDPGYANLGGPAPIIVQAKPSWARPGSVTAAAVLGFVAAGFCVVAAIWWFTTGEFANDVDRVGVDTGSYAAEAFFHGFANVFIAAALVLGGIGAVGRQPWGRWTLMAGAGGEALFSVYRLATGNFGNLVYLFMAIIVIALLAMPNATRYFSTRDPVHG